MIESAPTSLSARSLVASTLLGTHPPELPGRLLVALAARFGIAEGTARVALSRMVDRGELTNRDGTYALSGHLLARQQRQDTSRHHAVREWGGSWVLAVVTGPAGASQRAARRTSLTTLKLAELREGVWVRPDNLDPDRLSDEVVWEAPDVLWGTADLDVDHADLVAELWDLDGWAATASRLVEALQGDTARLRATTDAELAPGFELSAAVLRHFVADPALPAELLPEQWPGPALHQAYDAFDAEYRGHLRRFFRSMN